MAVSTITSAAEQTVPCSIVEHTSSYASIRTPSQIGFFAAARVARGCAAARIRLRDLQSLGDKLTSVDALRSGFFKTSVVDSDGRDQVTGLPMGGELLGLDGLGSGHYMGGAIALDDSDVCAMPYSEIEATTRQVVRRMSREEIRSYLGLKLETLSRPFSKSQQCGLLEVDLRKIAIVNIKGLERLRSPGG